MNLKIMMRRLNNRNLWLMLLSFLLVACQSYKKVPYFQDVEVVNEVEQQEKLYDARIMPKDLLTIVVSCTNPELADRKSTRLNSSHPNPSRMPSSA